MSLSSRNENSATRHRLDDSRIVGCIAIAWASLLVGNALVLPPCEGFDENAHFSYISVLADTGEIPDFRSTPVDGRLARERRGLPIPYGAASPFDRNGGTTYAVFWRLPQSERMASLERWWRPPPHSARYEPDKTPNWQGQHPPLYYALMAVPYRLTSHWSPGNQLTALRLSSVALAWAGVLFWLATLRRVESASARRTVLGAGLVVLWLPSCWYDLGRLGNDSLTCLVMSAVFYFLVCGARQGWYGWRDTCGLASALTVGLWTKGFFVPVWAASVLFVLWGCTRNSRLSRIAGIGRVAIIVLVPAVAIMPWLLWCLHRYGTPFPTVDLYRFAERGRPPEADIGVWRSTWEMLRKLVGSARTFLWCGTWSWVKRPLWTYGLMAPLLLTACAGLFSRQSWRDRETGQLRMAACVIVAGLVAGFVHFYSRCIYWTGSAIGGEGYYYFVAWLAVGTLLAGGAIPASGNTLRWLTPCALAAAWVFEISGHWLLFQLYAGVAQKMEPHGYASGTIWPTPDNLELVLGRLDQLTWSRAGMIAYAIAALCRWGAVLLLARPTRDHRSDRSFTKSREAAAADRGDRPA